MRRAERYLIYSFAAILGGCLGWIIWSVVTVLP